MASFDQGSSQERSPATETYTLGYQAASVTMAQCRLADYGQFFLPYLGSAMSLLDCGCAGTITVGLAEVVTPGKVVGIDIGESQVEKARACASDEGIANVSFQVASAYQMAFPNSSFDAVFVHTVPGHLSDPLRTLAGMRRVLKPGGVIGIRDGLPRRDS